MRHRLDQRGQRYGRVLDWRVSEQRSVELLEDLCEEMAHYTLVAQQQQQQQEQPAAAAAAAAAAAEGSDGQQGQQQQAAAAAPAAPEPAWVKRKGEGSVHVSSALRPAASEEELRAKQLTSFCGMLLERHEDAVVAALTADEFAAAGVAPVLCQRITSKCPGKEYPPPRRQAGGETDAASKDDREL